MGQLEAAATPEVEHPAPWEGATPEEDMAYDQQVKFGDMEFESEVGNYMGPYGREALDVDRATMMQKGGWTVLGLNTAPDINEDPELRERLDARYGKVFERGGVEMEPDMVYAIGPENANKQIWAHEFLHRYRSDKGMQALGGEERFVRLFGAYRANTPEQWIQAVDMWRSQTIKRGESMTLQQAEKHLKRTLDTWQSDFYRIEAEAAERLGERPKTRDWMFMDMSSLKSDYRELAEGREAVRDIRLSAGWKEILDARGREKVAGEKVKGGTREEMEDAARKFREEQDRRNRENGTQN